MVEANRVQCPHCKREFEVTAALTAQLEERLRHQFAAEKQALDDQLSVRETELRRKELQLSTERATIDEELQSRLATERQRISDEAVSRTKESLTAKLNQLEAQLTDSNKQREQAEAAMRERDAALMQRDQEMQRREADLQLARNALDAEVQSRVLAERDKLNEAAKTAAKEEMDAQFREMQSQLQSTRERLATAQTAELELRKREQQLVEKQQEFELVVARQVAAERDQIREAALRQAAEERQLKDAEHQAMIEGFKTRISELQQRVEQGSQQTQGEVLETELEGQLRSAFPYDIVEPVPKGVFGGDVIQRVITSSGQECGIILWEAKRTKTWGGDWTAKLKKDQRAATAEVAILVSTVMPKSFGTAAKFGLHDDVWVVDWRFAISLATVVRAGLTEVAAARRAVVNQQDKMSQIYAYLTGPQFRNRLVGIFEAFSTMKSDLDAERKAMQKTWAKREKQIELAQLNLAGFRGDLEGIAGSALPAVEQFNMPALPEPTPE